MKKIIITGATSMIGTSLIESAITNGTEVYAIVRPNTMRKNRLVKHDLVHLIEGSLDKLLDIEGIPYGCDVFYHFAWAGTSKEKRDDAWIHENNIEYTLNAVELASKIGCRRFVGAGSQAEYGTVDGIIDGTTRFAPVISYGIAKYASCILSRKLCEAKGIEHVWGRIFSVYGPHDNEWTMLRNAIDTFRTGEVARFSAGTQMWNYLYESDAGDIFYALGRESVKPGEYQVANIESKPLREYILKMMEVYGSEAKAEFAPDDGRKLQGLEVDASSTFEAIGFEPKVCFEEGIEKMIESVIKREDYNNEINSQDIIDNLIVDRTVKMTYGSGQGEYEGLYKRFDILQLIAENKHGMSFDSIGTRISYIAFENGTAPKNTLVKSRQITSQVGYVYNIGVLNKEIIFLRELGLIDEGEDGLYTISNYGQEIYRKIIIANGM
jgi:nucleoside-diphosphate-sugar epimerase